MGNIELKEDEEIIDLETSYIVLPVPSNSLEINITAKVWVDGEMKEVYKKMTFEEVREAFRDAEESYFPPDEEFSLTEKGRKLFEDLESGKIEWSDICL